MQNKTIGIGIKTFQKLADDKGHYGSIMFRSAVDDGAVSDDFHQVRRRRINPNVVGQSEEEYGLQTLNVVADAALFTDLDVSRFVNSLAIYAMLEAANQIRVGQDTGSFLSAFEIHTVKQDQPTMAIYLFFRKHKRSRIEQLHLDLQRRTVPGMEEFAGLGISMDQPGLTGPYLRTGPGGKPFLHGNKGDGPRGMDPDSDWRGYRVRLTFPDTPQFDGYADGNPGLTSHLDDAANIPLAQLTDLVIALKAQGMEAAEKSRIQSLIKSNSGSYEKFREVSQQPTDSIEHQIASDVDDLLDINMIHDVQKTGSADFWRNFK